MKKDNYFKYFSISLFLTWLFLFGLLPFIFVFFVSLMHRDPEMVLTFHFTLSHYFELFNPIYLNIFLKSFYVAGSCTLLCLIVAYPFAYFLTQVNAKWKNFLLLSLIIPFWTSSLVRSYAIITLIKTRGVLNWFLLKFGFIHVPLQLLFTNTAVMIGLVYNLLPFMILPLYTNIERMDLQLIEAARDLGAKPFTVFRRIILPLTSPGIIAGCILVFFPAMTVFYIPDLLGGAKSLLLGNLIEEQFLTSQNWPLGSAVSVTLTLIMGLMLSIYWRSSRGTDRRELV
ncbi:MAG: spermidine/putrescine ABC transporter permease PotB [Legionellales bacterium]|nr:spermidine/putrescine ABC transporter permease PotB [Legionellales bacterium]